MDRTTIAATHLPTLRALERFVNREGDLGTIARALFQWGLKPIVAAPNLDMTYLAVRLLTQAPFHVRMAVVSQTVPLAPVFYVEHLGVRGDSGCFAQVVNGALEITRITMRRKRPKISGLFGRLVLNDIKPEFNWSVVRDASWVPDKAADLRWLDWCRDHFAAYPRAGYDPSEEDDLMSLLLFDLATISLTSSPLFRPVHGAVDFAGNVLPVHEAGRA